MIIKTHKLLWNILFSDQKYDVSGVFCNFQYMKIFFEKLLRYTHIMGPYQNSIQQKRYPIMLFENNGTLQKWHLTNILPEINKYGIHQKMVSFQKWHHQK